jgi:MoxR-like ATPase
MGYPSRENEKQILRSQADAHTGATVQPVMEASDVLAMQQAASGVRVDDSLLDYALEIIEKTRHNERLVLGVSPRGSLMLQRAAQARAFVEGRDFCLPDDFKQMVVPVFAHRVVVNARYATTQKKTAQAEAVLAEIVESTPVPM